MRVRELALALPLVMGIAACKTSSTQGSTRTASADQRTSEQARPAPAPAQPQGEAQAQGSGDTSSGMASSTGSRDVAAHSDDEIVTGKITRLTPRSVTVATEDGSEKTLQLVPETSVMLDGRDADSSALEEGLPVRASFSTVDDRDVAVEIHAVKTPHAEQGAVEPGAGGTGGMGGSQSSGAPRDEAGTPPRKP